MTERKMWKFVEEDFVMKIFVLQGEKSNICQFNSSIAGLWDDHLLMFRGSKSKKSDDYRTYMSRHMFSNWLKLETVPRDRKFQKNVRWF